jgi:hypothetical protein
VYDFNAIEFISGDNTSVNPRLARLIEEHIGAPVPLLIGCASHKLNLAVDIFVEQAIYAPLFTKVSNLMKQLRTLKNSSKLRRHGLLMAGWLSSPPMLLGGVHCLLVCFVTTPTMLILGNVNSMMTFLI